MPRLDVRLGGVDEELGTSLGRVGDERRTAHLGQDGESRIDVARGCQLARPRDAGLLSLACSCGRRPRVHHHEHAAAAGHRLVEADRPRRVAGFVKSEALDLRKRFGDKRRTEVLAAENEFVVEDFIPDTPVVVTSTVGGYIKRVSVDTFKAQNRGGRGVIGIANLKREDVVQNFFMASTHEHVLFFTNKGRAYRLRAYEIPDSTRQARGTALVNLLTLPPGETVTAVFPIRTFEDGKFLVMVTRRGVIKKTSLDEFANVRKDGLNAVGLDESDELLAVDLPDCTRDIILATCDGMAVHLN